MSSSKLFCVLFLLLAVFQSYAGELDVQAKLQSMERRIKQLERMEGQNEKLASMERRMGKIEVSLGTLENN